MELRTWQAFLKMVTLGYRMNNEASLQRGGPLEALVNREEREIPGSENSISKESRKQKHCDVSGVGKGWCTNIFAFAVSQQRQVWKRQMRTRS